jgi:hypothetical protein
MVRPFTWAAAGVSALVELVDSADSQKKKKLVDSAGTMYHVVGIGKVGEKELTDQIIVSRRAVLPVGTGAEEEGGGRRDGGGDADG